MSEFTNDVKNCDLLIVGGGNAIFDLTRYSLSAYRINRILSIAKEYDKKVFITSIGIGPFKTKKQIDYTIDTLRLADYITVRDKKSFKYIETLNNTSYLSIDPAFLLKKVTLDDVKDSNKTKEISICIIDLFLNKESAKRYQEYISSFVALIDELDKENCIINLYSTEPRDYRAVYDVYNKLENKNNVRVNKIGNFNELIKLYSQTDLVIGTRMHSMIIALSQFIPVIGLSWQDKVTEMFDMVNLSEDVFDSNRFEKEIPNIINLVNEKLNNEQSIDQLKNIKHENEKRFEINIKLLKNLVEMEEIRVNNGEK
ncbi:hypothetical protein ACA29_22970 [Lederbergia galactosidilytica]|uniref:Polysaccharide pyruvyl transferase domain-containing protein n=1 Tax=Lederbergia galactosidilytica TaxID=217031 RepID=A0A0Q9Y025_9BACI|nr:hypothetical protein ACA29_22970 [Lederbergia galactosidilytica]